MRRSASVVPKGATYTAPYKVKILAWYRLVVFLHKHNLKSCFTDIKCEVLPDINRFSSIKNKNWFYG